MHDTWAVRDLPVLDATIGLLENSHMVTVTDIAAQTALDPSVVVQALEALDPLYVDFRKTTTGGDPRYWYVYKVTPEARRAVGQWPTAEALASRLAAELSAAADRESDGQRQSLLAYAARLIGDTLRDATLRAAEAVLTPAFGGIPVPEFGQQVPPPPPQPEFEFEFESLVPLPELPELLRPQRLDGQNRAAEAHAQAPLPVQAEPVPAEPVRAEPAPPPAQAEAPPPVQAKAAPPTEQAPPPVQAEPVQAEPAPPPAQAEAPPPVQAEPVQAEPAQATQTQPVPAPVEPATPAAPGLAPEAAWDPFRPSIAPWPAVDADTADTDAGAPHTHPDLLQARQDAV